MGLTFKQQLLLMLIDKLVIAVIVGLLLYRSQKRLEVQKARQSLEGEVVKARVESIAQGWKALNAWDLAVGDVICEFANFIKKEKPELDRDAGLDELGEPDLIQMANWLAGLNDDAIIKRVRQLCQLGLKNLLEKSVKHSGNARVIMQENRFWFGKDLYEHCKRFHATLHGICVSFGDGNFKKLSTQLVELNTVRQDVLSTLEYVRTRSYESRIRRAVRTARSRLATVAKTDRQNKAEALQIPR